MFEKKFVAAVDQGTSSTRCIIFDNKASLVSSAQKEHRQIYPSAGLVEHDCSEIWENTKEVISQALKTGNIGPDEIAAVGITNQRETTAIWDRQTGRPYHNAIVWQDTRTESYCDTLRKKGFEKKSRQITGLPIVPYFSGSKIRWLLDNVPEIASAAAQGRAAFGTIDSWLLWNLTGGIHATDVTNASRTMLMDLKTLKWSGPQLKMLGIPASLLPEIRSSSTIFGMTKKDGPFGAEIPVSGILGDQQAALFGQSCFQPGEAKNTYGTGCFLLMNTGETIVHSKAGLLTTVAYRIGDGKPVYALEGSVAIAGALVQWLRDNLGIIKTSSEIEDLAMTVKDNGGVFFVPAFSGLYAPWWKPSARGIISGLTRFANKGHLARAALESTAYQTRDIFQAMEKDSGRKLKELKVDGGMTRDALLMQFQADILDISVIRPRVTETTALGAAYAAGLSVGFWKGTDEIRTHWLEDKRWMPAMDKLERNRLVKSWDSAVRKSF